MTKKRERGRTGHLFWVNNNKNDPATLSKEVVRLSTIVTSDGQRKTTVPSDASTFDPIKIMALQKDVSILIADIKHELSSVLTIGACNSIGALRVGKLIDTFVQNHQEYIISNFSGYLAEETKDGKHRENKKMFSADITRLCVLYENVDSEFCRDYPNFWRMSKNFILQLVRTKKMPIFMKWYKVHYTAYYETCKSKISELLK